MTLDALWDPGRVRITRGPGVQTVWGTVGIMEAQGNTKTGTVALLGIF